MNNNRLHKILFAFLFLILLLPAFQKAYPIWKTSRLSGAVSTHSEPNFSWSSWWSGDYQSNQEKYLKDNIGGRNDLVHIHNQIDFSLFGEVHAKGVDVGKEGYLFERGYIDAYLGNYALPKEKIDAQVQKIKILQDTLAKLDKTLLVILAAGKGSYFPEYFPEKFQHQEKKISNYDNYAQGFAQNNINHIDFNKWFLELKDTISYPLFPKTGIHWSSYAEWLVADSVVSYLEQKRGEDWTDIFLEKVEWDKARGRDRDIEKGMNIIFELDKYDMPYPKLRYETAGKKRPNGLVVSDSYYWGLEHLGFTKNVFEEGHFWFYNNSIHPSVCGKNKVVDIDLATEISDKDVIILLATEATLSHFAWGFVYNLYELWFEPEKKAEREREARIQSYISKIKNDSKWLKSVEKKAEEKGFPLDSMLRLDAIYMTEQE